MNRDNYAEIAKTAHIQIPFIEDWMVGQILKAIPEPYEYSNVHAIVMALPSSYEKQAVDILKFLDSNDFISLDREALNTYGIMYTTDNIVIKIKEKLKNILSNL